MTTGPSPANRISRPTRFFAYIILSLIMVAVLVFLLRDGISSRFFSPAQENIESRFINGFILLILGIGILFILAELFNLNRQVYWLQRLQANAQQNDGRVNLAKVPALPNQLLAPVQSLFVDAETASSLSAQSSTAVIEAISGRIEERRTLSRWIIQTLIITGLIGTFWGLFGTISQIGAVIGALQGASADTPNPTMAAAEGFGALIENLQPVLQSMGVAFSSSLLGLSGSLLLGFLELQTGAAQNRFIEELEDWLYSITKLRSAMSVQNESGDFDQSLAAQQTLTMLNSVGNSLDRLRASIVRGEEDRAVTNRNIVDLGERIRELAQRHSVEQAQLAMLSQNAANFGPLLQRLDQQIDHMQAKADTDRALAQELRDINQRDDTALQINALAHQVQQLSADLSASLSGQTKIYQQLSERDAKQLSQGLERLGAVFAQAVTTSGQENAARLERAIYTASQEA